MSMAVRKKNRRKITCDCKAYVWYVSQDEESPYHVLTISSADKSLILSCPLGTATSYIISKGKIFQGEIGDGTWKRYLLPFKIPEVITSKFVAELIAWATGGSQATAVAFDGKGICV